MSNFTIPNGQGQTRQANRYETAGELNETFNINLNAPFGKINTSKTLTKVLDEDTNLDNGIVQAFEIYGNKYYLATDDDVFECSLTDDPTVAANWSKETGISGSGLGFETDMVVFNDLLLISQGTNITSWNGSSDDTDWWTTITSGAALTANKSHIMHVHRGGQETLFVTDDNKVRYYNTTAGHSTVTLQSDLTASCVASGVNATWVGTYTESSSNAYVYEIYVGEQINSVPVARNAYKVEGRAVLSIEVVDNIPYIVTEKGNLQAFNGAGFSTVESFPFTNTGEVLSGARPGLVQASSVSRPVHPKGMKLHNDSLYININTSVLSAEYPKRSPSGVWEYNKTTRQLNHRYSLGGAKKMGRSGALMILDNPETFLLVAGERDGETNGMWAESTVANTAYFVTKEIESETIKDAYENAYLKAKTLVGDENIEIKYRLTKRDRVFADGTLASANQFNTIEDVSTVEVGDEITNISTGAIAHVVSIEGTTTKAITLDRNIGTAGDSFTAEFENWKLEAAKYDSTSGEVKRFGSYGTNPWIQFKIVLNGNIEFRQFISKGNSKNEL